MTPLLQDIINNPKKYADYEYKSLAMKIVEAELNKSDTVKLSSSHLTANTEQILNAFKLASSVKFPTSWSIEGNNYKYLSRLSDLMKHDFIVEGITIYGNFGYEISIEDIETFAASIASLKDLQVISFRECYIKEPLHLNIILKSFVSLNKLSRLTIHVATMGDIEFATLASLLPKLENLKTLDISGKTLGIIGTRTMAECLKHTKNLISLNITAKEMDYKELDFVVEAIMDIDKLLIVGLPLLRQASTYKHDHQSLLSINGEKTELIEKLVTAIKAYKTLGSYPEINWLIKILPFKTTLKRIIENAEECKPIFSTKDFMDFEEFDQKIKQFDIELFKAIYISNEISYAVEQNAEKIINSLRESILKVLENKNKICFADLTAQLSADAFDLLNLDLNPFEHKYLKYSFSSLVFEIISQLGNPREFISSNPEVLPFEIARIIFNEYKNGNNIYEILNAIKNETTENSAGYQFTEELLRIIQELESQEYDSEEVNLHNFKVFWQLYAEVLSLRKEYYKEYINAALHFNNLQSSLNTINNNEVVVEAKDEELITLLINDNQASDELVDIAQTGSNSDLYDSHN
jgi:hypothetical protein